MDGQWRIKRGDNVVVTTGKDKAKTGQVMAVDRSGRRVIVQGINMATRHQPARSGNPGGLVRKEMPIHASNVMIVDPKLGKATRVGIKFLEDGRKVRIAKASGTIID